MIRVLALYSQRMQQIDISAESVTYHPTAKRLAYVLKMLLALETIAKVVTASYITATSDSEKLIDLHIAWLDKSIQLLFLALAREDIRYAEQRVLLRQWFLLGSRTGMY